MEIGDGGWRDMNNKKFDVEVSVSDLVIKIGIPAHLKGFKYIRTAIILVMEDVSYIGKMMERLYPNVAEIHGGTSQQVERSIRSAIDVAWYRGGENAIVELLGGNYGKPTNSELIAIAAERLKLQKRMLDIE